MKVSYSDLKKTFPDEKKSIESLYGRIIPVRKISYIVTMPFLWLNMSAFSVSVISIFAAIAACVFLSLPFEWSRITGIVLVFFWHLLDCVDGNIARYRKTASHFGGVVDAISGYYFFAFFPLAFGIASFNIGQNYFSIPPFLFLVLGGIASISDLLMRLIYQKYRCAELEFKLKDSPTIQNENSNHGKLNSLVNKIQVECGPLGLPMFALWAAPVFNLFCVLTIYYCVFFTASALCMTVLYLRKCRKADV